jgi:hypothetical protein
MELVRRMSATFRRLSSNATSQSLYTDSGTLLLIIKNRNGNYIFGTRKSLYYYSYSQILGYTNSGKDSIIFSYVEKYELFEITEMLVQS